jgi:hypothetical protein
MLATNAHAPEVAEPLSSWSTTRYVRVSSRVGESMLFLVVRARAGSSFFVSFCRETVLPADFWNKFGLFENAFRTNLASSRTHFVSSRTRPDRCTGF